MIDKEVLQAFRQRYEEILESHPGSISERKAAAFNEASLIIVGIGDYLSAYRVSMAMGKKREQLNDDELIGYLINHHMKDAVLKVIGKNGPRKRDYQIAPEPEPPEPEEEQADMADMIEKHKHPLQTELRKPYIVWIEEHLWIPTDDVISYLTKVKPNTINAFRRDMHQKGWEFERRNNGWYVTKKGSSMYKPGTKQDLDADTLARAIVQLRKQGLI